MNRPEINPFQELYVTDSPDPNVFVRLFSDVPVMHSQMLFRPGNVILKGTQGSGKSMLLNLFRPTIRVAYYKANEKFPVPRMLSKFIGAGINLTRSGALDIGQIPISNEIDDTALFPLLFSDFLNYFIVRDILETIIVMGKQPEVFCDLVNNEHLDKFAQIISNEPCWFKALKKCRNFEDLCRRIDMRIESYRSFHLSNKDLPKKVLKTKTDIGEPIAKTAECLKASNVIPEDTPIFIRIDQIERLYRSDLIRLDIGKQYRRIINKALGKRDQRVSYRIGTRRYAWEDDLNMYGTGDELEHIRDFRICDLDDILRRKEDRKTWIFPSFSEDAFTRRLELAGFDELNKGNLIGDVFGSKKSPIDAAQYHSGSGKAKKILKYENDWPNEWKSFLRNLFKGNKLEALLATAWARQRGNKGKPGWRLKEPPPVDKKPWNRTYWRKERIRQALLQIAARNQQRLQWCGKEQILALSSGNISIFLSICHEVWEVHLRFQRYKDPSERIDPVLDKKEIEPEIQAVGIHTCSTEWYQKITEHPKGDYHQTFIDVLGRKFRRWLLDDLALSYPGHNGFSISKDDLLKYPKIKQFLDNAVDYGDLYEMPHTTKMKNRKPRIKWYLNPILSAYFQIPESHIKEPYYIKNMDEVVQWMKEAKLPYKQYIDTKTSPNLKSKTNNSTKSPYHKQKLLPFKNGK